MGGGYGMKGPTTAAQGAPYYTAFAGTTVSENDADASVAKAVAGVLATDIVLATVLSQAGTATILKAVPTTDTLTFTLSGNGGAGTVIQYAVLRASA